MNEFRVFKFKFPPGKILQISDAGIKKLPLDQLQSFAQGIGVSGRVTTVELIPFAMIHVGQYPTVPI